MNQFIKICEVAPRDGLQNEPKTLPVENRIEFIKQLRNAGCQTIEVGSFVNPKAVPAMADSLAVFQGCRELIDDGHLSVLVMNERGLEQALDAGVKSVSMATFVSDTLCLKNTRKDAASLNEHVLAMCRTAKQEGLFVRLALSPAWHCPYEGKIPVESVLKLFEKLYLSDADEIALGDTIGAAVPNEVSQLLERISQYYPVKRLAVHLHDTRGFALANAAMALQAGVRIFDTSSGGLGGCPFAPGARGNLATEDLVLMSRQMGFEHGIDIDQLVPAIESIGRQLEKSVGGRCFDWWKSQSTPREHGGSPIEQSVN